MTKLQKLQQQELRDKIAMHVIGGMVADPNVTRLTADAEIYARSAYAVADAMLKVRQEKKQ